MIVDVQLAIITVADGEIFTVELASISEQEFALFLLKE